MKVKTDLVEPPSALGTLVRLLLRVDGGQVLPQVAPRHEALPALLALEPAQARESISRLLGPGYSY